MNNLNYTGRSGSFGMISKDKLIGVKKVNQNGSCERRISEDMTHINTYVNQTSVSLIPQGEEVVWQVFGNQ
ncbi:MAG: hypothetical protein HN826_07650 [Methylococcales bacterium]|jgi:hypothetical protein|nr:hypothetical protein [Methylococcales bacterium]